MHPLKFSPYKRPGGDSEELYIGGQCIQRVGNEIRAPLCVLGRLTREVEFEVVVHKAYAPGTDRREFWFSIRCGTAVAAEGIMTRVRAMYPAGITCAERLARERGDAYRKMA